MMEDWFGASGPAFEVLAPGRVNLIGDHIDYLGFDVLPVALKQRIRFIGRPRHDGLIRVLSTLHNEEVSFAARPSLPPAPSGHWSNYVRAAVQELCTPSRMLGFEAVISSDLPPAAGLSSSSALVVASGLAYLCANGESTDRLDLAERMARAERYVGTAGGGMDQAVCLLARAGSAARICFSPLRVTHVTIPPHWQFLVADSLEQAEKSGSVREAYNARAQEAREAVALVARSLSSDPPVSEREEAAIPAGGALMAGEVIAAATALTGEGLLAGEVLTVGERRLGGQALRRFRHVISEADRVRSAVVALHEDNLTEFGRCMNESHASLRNDFEVSTPALDHLCEILRTAGAHGARLTGAGLGGSVVALCSAESAEQLIDAVDTAFYAVRGISASRRERFPVEPSGGAHVFLA